ncbi:MAG: hypothetical protein ACYDB7_15685 [Mycobacteriales bacterium]
MLRELRVARISVGSGLFRATLAAVRRMPEDIAAGEPTWWRQGDRVGEGVGRDVGVTRTDGLGDPWGLGVAEARGGE